MSQPFPYKTKNTKKLYNSVQLFTKKKIPQPLLTQELRYSNQEAPTRFELVIEVLQTFALPLGYGALLYAPIQYSKCTSPSQQKKINKKTIFSQSAAVHSLRSLQYMRLKHLESKFFIHQNHLNALRNFGKSGYQKLAAHRIR